MVPWSIIRTVCKPAGSKGMIRLSTTDNGISFSSADGTGRMRGQIIVPSDEGVSDVVIPFKLITAMGRDQNPTLQATSRMVRLTTDLGVWTANGTVDSVPGVVELDGMLPFKPADLIASLALSSAVDGDKDQTPFRTVILSGPNSVAGLSGGRLIVRGPGLDVLGDEIIQVPADAVTWIRAVLKVLDPESSQLAWTAKQLTIQGATKKGESLIKISCALDATPTPLAGMIVSSSLDPFKSALSGPGEVDPTELGLAIKRLSGVGTIDLTVSEDGDEVILSGPAGPAGRNQSEERVSFTGPLITGRISVASLAIASKTIGGDPIRIWGSGQAVLLEGAGTALILGER